MGAELEEGGQKVLTSIIRQVSARNVMYNRTINTAVC